MSDDDFLRPGDDPAPLEEEERDDDVASDEATEAMERHEEDEAPGIEGPEHFGLTPPD